MSALATPLLAPDAAVPAREALLDPAGMGARIAAALGAPGAVERCDVLRATYRRGVRVRVLYAVEGGFGRRLVAASTFPTPTRFVRALATAEAGPATAPFGPGGADDDIGAVLWAFPNDRKLRSLAAVAGGGLRLAGAPLGELVPVAWAPEKAATLAVERDGVPAAFVKVHADGTGMRTAAVHRTLRAALGPHDRDLAIPTVLAADEAAGATAVAAVAGTPLGALPPEAMASGMRRLGAALARLHGLPAPDGQRFERLAPERLPAAAGVVADARPDLADEAHALTAALAAAAPAPAPDATCHGDAHPKNAVLADGRVALIDLDQAGRAPAAADLGGVLAGLVAARVTGALDARDEAALADALLDGYAAVAAAPSGHDLRWHTAAALLAERAVRAVTRLRAESLAALPQILAASRETTP